MSGDTARTSAYATCDSKFEVILARALRASIRSPAFISRQMGRLPNGAELADTWEMSKISFLAAVLCCGLAQAQSPSSVASTIVANANSFLRSLDEGQRSKVLFDFNDAAQRVKWSNLPTTMVPRAGLKMGDLSEAQRKAAMALLAATLSKRGYEKVLAIVAGDEALKAASGG